MAKENQEHQEHQESQELNLHYTLSENRRIFIEESGLNKYWDAWMEGGEMPQLGALIKRQRAMLKRYNSVVFHLLSAMHEYWAIEEVHQKHG